jgi:protein-tyrosine phosphatase
MKKVLFVCTANVCRSPMAEAIFNALAEDREFLPFRAESAGTAALEGRPMDPNAVATLREAGIYPEPHRARRVGGAKMEEAELVLAMGPPHAAALRRLEGDPGLGIHTLPEYAADVAGEEVSDPYGLMMLAYRSTLRQLHGYVKRVVDRLEG